MKQEESIVIGKAWRPVVVWIVLILTVGNLPPEQVELLTALLRVLPIK